jgi:CRP/FNR family transcriptional regulator
VTQTSLFTAKQGQTIFQPGQECPGFLDLTKGSIRVMLTGASGREVVLYRVRPGEVCLQTFSCLVDGHTYGVEGIVETDIEGTLIPASLFRQQMEADPEVVLVFRPVLCRAALGHGFHITRQVLCLVFD